MKLLVILCIVGIAFATPLNKPYAARMAGGTNAIAGELKFMAAIEGNLGSFCGGVIINQHSILTDFQCTGIIYDISPILSPFEARLGSLKRGTGGQTIRVIQMIPHPDLNVGIILVRDPIIMGDQVAPIKLYTSANMPNNVTVAGWGPSTDGILAPLSKDLKKITVPVRTDAACRQHFGISWNSTTTFCADQAACRQDAGGPAYIIEDGVPKLVGIIGHRNPCAFRDYPGEYYKIASISSWIQEYLDNNPDIPIRQMEH